MTQRHTRPEDVGAPTPPPGSAHTALPHLDTPPRPTRKQRVAVCLTTIGGALHFHAWKCTGPEVTTPLHAPQAAQALYIALRDAGWTREERRLVRRTLLLGVQAQAAQIEPHVTVTPHLSGRTYLTVTAGTRTAHIRAGERTTLASLEATLRTWPLGDCTRQALLAQARQTNDVIVQARTQQRRMQRWPHEKARKDSQQRLALGEQARLSLLAARATR